MKSILNDIRLVVSVGLAVLLALVALVLIWKVVTFVMALVASLITILVLAAIVYGVFLIARSSFRRRHNPA